MSAPQTESSAVCRHLHCRQISLLFSGLFRTALRRGSVLILICRGSVLIQESCRANGLPEPQWTADENSVTLTFTAKSGMSRQVAQDGGVEQGKENSKEKSKEKILALLSVNPHATTADLIAETGLSVSGVEKNIRELKAVGRLRRVGPDKGGHWEVVEP